MMKLDTKGSDDVSEQTRNDAAESTSQHRASDLPDAIATSAHSINDVKCQKLYDAESTRNTAPLPSDIHRIVIDVKDEDTVPAKVGTKLFLQRFTAGIIL